MSATWDHERWSEELAAYLLGALEPDGAAVFERHLQACERCREEMRWLAPALDALPETVARLEPPPQLRVRLLAEAHEDSGPAEEAAAATRPGLLARLRDVLGPRWRPLAAAAAVLLIVAAVVGYEVGSDGSGGGVDATTVEATEPSGIVAAVSMEGTTHGRIKLSNVNPLPRDKVLEAWVERDGEVEAVPTLFVPNSEGEAATRIGDMRGVSAVMVTTEPPGGSEAPTAQPIATVAIPPS